MKRILLYMMLFACFIRIPICAQVGFVEYKAMFDIVKDSLDIDQAYVSDSLREHRLLGLYLHLINSFINPLKCILIFLKIQHNGIW